MPGFNESLNMGRTFISLTTSQDYLELSHSGQFDMFSQNLIHTDLLNGFHLFDSSAPNSFNVTGGIQSGTH